MLLPLMNFCRFLLKAIEKRNGKLFEMLVGKYDEALQRDEIFKMKYLPKIAKLYFGVTLADDGQSSSSSSSSGMSGMLNTMLQSMFGGASSVAGNNKK